MRLVNGKKYIVDVMESPFIRCGRYCLYFRSVHIDDDNCLILNFSETLEDNTVFYNFFQCEKIRIYNMR